MKMARITPLNAPPRKPLMANSGIVIFDGSPPAHWASAGNRISHLAKSGKKGVTHRNSAHGGVASSKNGRRRPQRVRQRSDHVLTTGLIQNDKNPKSVPYTPICVL